MTREQLRIWAARYVLAVLVGIGAYDLVTGFVLLLAREPHLVAPFDTLTLDPGGGAVALLRRLGAFGVVVGSTTVAWAWLSREDRRLRSVMLVVYLVAGISFAVVDRQFFAGAAGYTMSKTVIGAAFALAVAAHFLGGGKREG